MSTKSVGSVKSIVSYGSSSKKSKSSSSQSGKSSVSGKSKATNSKSSKAGVSTKCKANSSQGTKANAKMTSKARSSQNNKANTKENSTVTSKNSVKPNNMVVKAASQISTTIQQMNTIQTGKNNSGNKNVEDRTTYITDAPALYTSSGQKISSSVAQVYSTKKEEPSLSSYSYNQPSCVYEEQVKQLKKKANKNQKAINEPKATPIPTPVVKTKNQTKKAKTVYEPSESRHGAGAVSKTKPSSSKAAKETASLIISTVPVIGDIKDAQEALTGKDLITKKKLSKVDRGISSVSVVAPIVSGKSITSMEKLMSNLKEDIWDSVKKNNLSDKRVDGLKEIGERVKEFIEETEKEGKKKKETEKKKVFTDNPFRKDGKLKPNVRYKAGEFGYNYETDEKGRISNWNTDNLQITKRENRLPHNPNTPDKKEGDHAGHLAGDKFGGSPEIDNLVSQSSVVNQSLYRMLEIRWQKAIEAGKKVQVNMDIGYEGESLRPSEFMVMYSIDKKKYSTKFNN